MLSNKKILVLSNSSLTCHFFESFEESMDNCQVKLAETFDKIKELMVYFTFDVFVIDAKSIGVEPEKATSYIKEQPDHIFTPILMISGNLKKSFVRQMLQIGVTDFLIEPLEEDECLLRIEMAIQSMQKSQKMQQLSPDKLLLNDAAAPALKGVHLISPKLSEVVTRCIQTDATLALLHVEIHDKENHLVDTEIKELLQKQMRHQDILLMKHDHCFLVILEYTTFRAATFIGENLFESLLLFIKKEGVAAEFGIGGSFLESPFPSKKDPDIVLGLEKLALNNAALSLNNKKMVISKAS